MVAWLCFAILFGACVVLCQEISKARKATAALHQEVNGKNIAMERAAQAIEISRKHIADLTNLADTLQTTLDFQLAQYDKLIGQKKSSETRLGQISEQIAPFLTDYPFDPKQARFIGDPIDIISFCEDKITFIEVKSGKSQLSKRQREIRDMIKEGKVDFMIFRIEGNDEPDPI